MGAKRQDHPDDSSDLPLGACLHGAARQGGLVGNNRCPCSFDPGCRVRPAISPIPPLTGRRQFCISMATRCQAGGECDGASFAFWLVPVMVWCRSFSSRTCIAMSRQQTSRATSEKATANPVFTVDEWAFSCRCTCPLFPPS